MAPTHAAPDARAEAYVAELLGTLGPVLQRAARCRLQRLLGPDGVAVVLVEVGDEGRFAGRARAYQRLLEGERFRVLVVPRAAAREAVDAKCAHCGEQFEATFAHRVGEAARVLHVDVAGRAFTGVYAPAEGVH